MHQARNVILFHPDSLWQVCTSGPAAAVAAFLNIRRSNVQPATPSRPGRGGRRHSWAAARGGPPATPAALRRSTWCNIAGNRLPLHFSRRLDRSTGPLLRNTRPLLGSSQRALHFSQPLLRCTRPLRRSSQPLLRTSRQLLRFTRPPLRFIRRVLHCGRRPLRSTRQPLRSSRALLRFIQPLLRCNWRLLYSSLGLKRFTIALAVLSADYAEKRGQKKGRGPVGIHLRAQRLGRFFIRMAIYMLRMRNI